MKSGAKGRRKEYVSIKLIRGVFRALRSLESKSWIAMLPPGLRHTEDRRIIEAGECMERKYRRKKRALHQFASVRYHFTKYAPKRDNSSQARYYKCCNRQFFTDVMFPSKALQEIYSQYLDFVFCHLDEEEPGAMLVCSDLNVEVMSVMVGLQCCKEDKHGEICAEKWRRLKDYLKSRFLTA